MVEQDCKVDRSVSKFVQHSQGLTQVNLAWVGPFLLQYLLEHLDSRVRISVIGLDADNWTPL